MLHFISNYKKTFIFLIILLIAIIGGFLYYQSTATTQVKVQTVKVEQGDIVSSISATGTVQPVNSVDVSSKITGRIVEVKVEENDWVTEGDILVILDDVQYKSDLARSEATLKNAQANYQRLSKLLNDGAISRQDYDVAEKDYLVAKAAYDTSVSNLDDTIIRAPVTGRVIGKPIPAGQTVAPGISTPMVIMTIADMSLMQSETLVDESDIGQVKNGQNVEFTVDSYSDLTFHGLVSLISSKAETANNVIYYKVYVDVTDSRDKLFPGMTSRVNILTDERRNVLTLPLSAVRENKGQSYAQKILPNGVVEDIEVTVGLRGDERLEILSGLSLDDEVALKPTSKKTTNPVGGPGGRPF